MRARLRWAEPRSHRQASRTGCRQRPSHGSTVDDARPRRRRRKRHEAMLRHGSAARTIGPRLARRGPMAIKAAANRDIFGETCAEQEYADLQVKSALRALPLAVLKSWCLEFESGSGSCRRLPSVAPPRPRRESAPVRVPASPRAPAVNIGAIPGTSRAGEGRHGRLRRDWYPSVVPIGVTVIERTGNSNKKPRFREASDDGSDGTRTRDLRRDRPAL